LQRADFLLTNKQLEVLFRRYLGGKSGWDFATLCDESEAYREKVWGVYLYAADQSDFAGKKERQLEAFLHVIEREGFILQDKWLTNRLVKYMRERFGWELDASGVQCLVTDLVVRGDVMRIGAVSRKGTYYTCSLAAIKADLLAQAIDFAMGMAMAKAYVEPRELLTLKDQWGERGRSWEHFILDHLVFLGRLMSTPETDLYILPGASTR